MPYAVPYLDIIVRTAGALVIILLAVLGIRYLERYLALHIRRPLSPFWLNYVRAIKYLTYTLSALVAIYILTKVYPAIYLIFFVLLLLVVAFVDMIRNWGSGFYLRLMNFLKIGDEVEIGGIEGTVIDVNDYGVTLLSPKREVIYIPNTYLMRNPITNRSTGLSTMYKVTVAVPLEKDELHVLETLNDIMTEIRGDLVSHPRVFKEGEREGYSLYAIEYELLNTRKNEYILSKIEESVRERLGEASRVLV